MGFGGVQLINPQEVLDSLLTKEQQTHVWNGIVFFCTMCWAYGAYKLFLDPGSLKVKKAKRAKKIR